MFELPLDCWTRTGAALGQASHISGCLGVDAYAEDARCLDLDAPGLGLIFSTIAYGAGVLEYVAWNDRMSALRQPCWAVPKGSTPFYRLIIDASSANEMYSDWGVSYTAGAQLSSTPNRCNFTSSVKCWPRGRRLSFSLKPHAPGHAQRQLPVAHTAGHGNAFPGDVLKRRRGSSTLSARSRRGMKAEGVDGLSRAGAKELRASEATQLLRSPVDDEACRHGERITLDVLRPEITQLYLASLHGTRSQLRRA